jgi:hypothetical protein
VLLDVADCLRVQLTRLWMRTNEETMEVNAAERTKIERELRYLHCPGIVDSEFSNVWVVPVLLGKPRSVFFA